MAGRYAVRRRGAGWVVTTARGARVGWFSCWASAVGEAHRLASAERVRDQKHEELFRAVVLMVINDVRRVLDTRAGWRRPRPRRSDFVLAT